MLQNAVWYRGVPGKPGRAGSAPAPRGRSAVSAMRRRSSSASEGRSGARGGPSMEEGPAWAATCWMSVSRVVSSSCSSLSFRVFSDLQHGALASSAQEMAFLPHKCRICYRGHAPLSKAALDCNGVVGQLPPASCAHCKEGL